MTNAIAAIEYELREQRLSLEILEEKGLLESPAEQLREFGFGSCRVSDRMAVHLAESIQAGPVRLFSKYFLPPPLFADFLWRFDRFRLSLRNVLCSLA